MNEITITEDWRRNVPYKEVGIYKVADLEKIAEEIVKERTALKQSMFITIAAIKIDKHKELNNTLRFCTDPYNGVMYGLNIGLMPDGNIKWRAVMLNEMNTFNLNLLNDAIQYAFIRMHPKVMGSPFQMGTDHVYKIIDQDRIAAQKTQHYILQGNALHIAKTMKKNDLLAFGRYLGLFYEIDASAAIIRASLFEQAARMPIDFLDKYNNPSRKFIEVIKAAIVVGAITHDYDKGYKYRTLSLGHSESDILTKLMNDGSLLDSIKQETVKRDSTWKSLQKETEKEIDIDLKAAVLEPEFTTDEE
jgi:hypothetical protein